MGMVEQYVSVFKAMRDREPRHRRNLVTFCFTHFYVNSTTLEQQFRYNKREWYLVTKRLTFPQIFTFLDFTGTYWYQNFLGLAVKNFKYITR